MSNPDMKLPPDIAAAIDAVQKASHEFGLDGAVADLRVAAAARTRLDAAILTHLAELRGSHECVEQHLEDVCAENERLRAFTEPDGWVLVPRTATNEMTKAGDDADSEHDGFGDYYGQIWAAMVDAAPARPAAAEGE